MSLRVVAARGVVVNGVFIVGLNFLTLLKGFVAAALLTTSEYGLWGILSITLIGMLWLKDLGVADRFVYQRDDDQERAFQEAFSVQLFLTGSLCVVMIAAMPGLAALYGQPELVAPGIALALLLPGLSLQAPLWAHYRELRFMRQRTLQAIDPVLSFVVTIGLAIAGAGYWSLVIATVVGTWLTGLVALRSVPYKLRWRLTRPVLRSYLSFSWPLFVTAFNGLIITQVSIITGEATLGLAGVAAITLAATVNRYSQKLDEAISATLYPVVARVRDRRDLLLESFEKSNRLALLWAAPFGAAFALFAPDLVRFALGDDWSGAAIVLQLVGIAAIVNQIGFNWSAFYRARGETRPIAIASWIALATFLALVLPLLLAFGLAGYGAGMVALSVVNAHVRGFFLRRLFGPVDLVLHAARAIAPTLPAAGLILLLRAVEVAQTRTLAIAIVELVAYCVLAAVSAAYFERRLLREIVRYLRRARPMPAPDTEVEVLTQ